MTDKTKKASAYKLHLKRFYDPIYHIKVVAVVGGRNNFQKYLTENYSKEEYGSDIIMYGGAYLGMQDGELWLWVEDPKNWYIIVHECIHLTIDIFKRKGICTDIYMDQEPFAYYHNYWVRTLWEWCITLKKEKANG